MDPIWSLSLFSYIWYMYVYKIQMSWRIYECNFLPKLILEIYAFHSIKILKAGKASTIDYGQHRTMEKKWKQSWWIMINVMEIIIYSLLFNIIITKYIYLSIFK